MLAHALSKLLQIMHVWGQLAELLSERIANTRDVALCAHCRLHACSRPTFNLGVSGPETARIGAASV